METIQQLEARLERKAVRRRRYERRMRRIDPNWGKGTSEYRCLRARAAAHAAAAPPRLDGYGQRLLARLSSLYG